MFTAPKDPLIGQAVDGSYVITRQLGEGGMEAVYLAASVETSEFEQAAAYALSLRLQELSGVQQRYVQEVAMLAPGGL